MLLGGDEIAAKRAAVRTDFADPRDVVRSYLPHLAPAATVTTRLRAAGTAAVRARAIVRGYSRANCEVAARMAERLGLGSGVRDALADIYEQWDGRGGPRGVRGEAIPEPARIAQVAATAALLHREAGAEAAVAGVRRRAGAALDPALAELLARRSRDILGPLDGADPLEAAVAAEPEPGVRISDAGLDRVCRAFGEAVDLKTPLHHGHATGVATLAAAAGARAGLGAADVDALRRAGLLHDLGRAAVPNGVWECAGPLTWADQERVRLHAYHSERVLARCGPLAPLAPLAGMHHERLDGSGYHRQATAAALPLAARVLAAADAFQAMTQPRAHRPARAPAEAAAQLTDDARAGRLDPDAVRAVVEAAGERPGRAAARSPRRADRAAGRGAAARRAGAVEPAHRRAARHLAAHRRAPRAGRVRPHRRLQPCGRGAVRHGARPARPRLVGLPMRAARAGRILPSLPTHPRRRSAMEPKEVVRRFVDEYQTAADERAFDELLDPDVVDHDRPPGVEPGAPGVRQQFDGFRASFSGFRATILEQLADGDKVVTRKVFTGTHDGPFQGIAPTGREVEIHVIDIVRVAGDRIVEHWGLVDRLGLLAQLGALPGAPAAAAQGSSSRSVTGSAAPR
jgi:HD-GYP domain-containing protein (c-di-GMP phosphodiesterase class II)/predicted ester cyclase